MIDTDLIIALTNLINIENISDELRILVEAKLTVLLDQIK